MNCQCQNGWKLQRPDGTWVCAACGKTCQPDQDSSEGLSPAELTALPVPTEATPLGDESEL